MYEDLVARLKALPHRKLQEFEDNDEVIPINHFIDYPLIFKLTPYYKKGNGIQFNGRVEIVPAYKDYISLADLFTILEYEDIDLAVAPKYKESFKSVFTTVRKA